MEDVKYISGNELRQRCLKAINEHWSREQLLLQLRSERKKIGIFRLNRMWASLNGPVQDSNYRKR